MFYLFSIFFISSQIQNELATNRKIPNNARFVIITTLPQDQSFLSKHTHLKEAQALSRLLMKYV